MEDAVHLSWLHIYLGLVLCELLPAGTGTTHMKRIQRNGTAGQLMRPFVWMKLKTLIGRCNDSCIARDEVQSFCADDNFLCLPHGAHQHKGKSFKTDIFLIKGWNPVHIQCQFSSPVVYASTITWLNWHGMSTKHLWCTSMIHGVTVFTNYIRTAFDVGTLCHARKVKLVKQVSLLLHCYYHVVILNWVSLDCAHCIGLRDVHLLKAVWAAVSCIDTWTVVVALGWVKKSEKLGAFLTVAHGKQKSSRRSWWYRNHFPYWFSI